MTLSISAGVGSDIGLHPVPQTPFEAPAPNRKWIADFTYVWTAEGWLYVAVVIDLFFSTRGRLVDECRDDSAARHRCPEISATIATIGMVFVAC